MSLQVNKDGRPVNTKLTKQELEQAEKDEKHTQIVDEAIKETDGYQHLGELTPQRQADGSLAVTVTEDHLKPDLKSARMRRFNNQPVIPVFFIEDEHGEIHWFLNYDDAQMGLAGYLCFDVEFGTGCLEWQKDHTKDVCNPVSKNVPSCGRKKHVS